MNNLLATTIKQNLSIVGNSTRLFHGRGNKFPGLEHITIDFYSPTLLIVLYKETVKEHMDSIIDSIDFINAENVLVQKRYLSRPTLEAYKGSIPTSAFAVENSLKFNLKLGDSQNIGFFLDMSKGRELLGRISKNKKVLNLFSYTCSLSVAAIAGGASSVVNIDMSKAALAAGESNHILNQLDMKSISFLPYDIMNSWNNIFKKGPFDIIVIDPPTNQGDSFKVDRDYYKIVKRLNKMASKEAIIIACLNSPFLSSKFLMDIFLEHAPEFKFQEVIYSAFSEMETNPEEGLKIVVFKKDYPKNIFI